MCNGKRVDRIVFTNSRAFDLPFTGGAGVQLVGPTSPRSWLHCCIWSIAAAGRVSVAKVAAYRCAASAWVCAPAQPASEVGGSAGLGGLPPLQ